jgi:hypothetical protein
LTEKAWKLFSVDRNGSLWIARSTAFLPDLAIRQEQTAVHRFWDSLPKKTWEGQGISPRLLGGG